MQEHELLIARAKKGDNAAFDELLGIYEKRIYNVALRTMKNRDDACDMAQEAIIKVYKNLISFKGECTFAVWIHRITVNTCLDEIRRRKKKMAISIDAIEGGIQIEDTDETPEQRLERLELKEVIAVAINSLEDDYRLAITLRDVQGLSYTEVSEITGATLGTVKSRINRARAQLQKKLESYRQR